jgi:hypothetical protein
MDGLCGTSGRKWNGYRILVGKSEGRKLLLRPGCGSEDILTGILKNQDGRAWTVFIYRCQGWVEGCYEHSVEFLVP